KEPGRALDADYPPQQGPQPAPFFRQEAEPRLAVGGHTQVGLSLMPRLDLQRAVPDRHGRLLRFLAGEGEVVDGVQLRRLPRLERERKTRQESLDRAGPQAVADPFDRLEGETAGHMLLGVRAGDDVDRLLLLLQRTNDLPQMPGPVGQIRADHVLPRRADGLAV